MGIPAAMAEWAEQRHTPVSQTCGVHNVCNKETDTAAACCLLACGLNLHQTLHACSVQHRYRVKQGSHASTGEHITYDRHDSGESSLPRGAADAMSDVPVTCCMQ